MPGLEAIIARIKEALASEADFPNHAPSPSAPLNLPVEDRRAELLSQFTRELEAVAGRIVGPVAPEDLAGSVLAIVRQRGVKSIAIGGGGLLDLDGVARACAAEGVA